MDEGGNFAISSCYTMSSEKIRRNVYFMSGLTQSKISMVKFDTKNTLSKVMAGNDIS